MSRRALLLVALLCPACASGTGPSDPGDPDPQKTDSPAPRTPSRGDAPAPDPPADVIDPPSHPADPPSVTPPASTPDHGDDDDADCKALLELLENLGCAIAQLACAVAKDVHVHGAQVPCDIAVPVACGIGSAVADAAAALCHH
jgi:hypothetical protein